MNNHTHIPHCAGPWPKLNYKDWSPTLKTIHMWSQIVGKIRLVSMPWQNHSWHTALYITSRGLSTGSIPFKNGIFEIEFDFENHVLTIRSTFSKDEKIALYARSVADFYNELFSKLKSLGIDINIHAYPNEVISNTPFYEDEINKSYDKQQVLDFWQAAVNIHNVFSRFRGEFIGKCSPVHLFWGAFDIAVTRFSGKSAPLHQGSMPNMPKAIMQEAYSQEVSSAGFWPGSDDFPQAMFYSYCYPKFDGFENETIVPKEAFWSPEMGEYFLPYDIVRQSDNPEKLLTQFLQSTYIAAAKTGQWDRSSLEKPN